MFGKLITWISSSLGKFNESDFSENSEKLEEIIETIPSPAVSVNKKGEIIKANEEFKDYFNFDDIQNQGIDEALKSSVSKPLVLESMKRDEELKTDIIPNAWKDEIKKEVKYYLSRSKPIKNNNNNLIGGIEIIQDITNTMGIFKQLPSYFLLTDDEGKVIISSQKTLDTYERDLYNSVGIDPKDFYDNDDVVALDVIESGEPILNEEVEANTPKGKFPIQSSVIPLKSEGRIEGSVEIYHDISDIKRREEQLNSIIEESPISIYIIDENREITRWNKGMEAYFGIPKEEAIGRKPSEILPKPEYEEMKDSNGDLLIEKSLREGENYYNIDATATTEDGNSLYYVTSSVVLEDDQGEIFGSVEVIKDIKDLKEKERELNAIITQLPINVFMIDKDHRITRWNEAMADYTKVDPEEAMGEKPIEVLAGADSEASGEGTLADKALNREEKLMNVEGESIDSEGNKRYDISSAIPLKNEDGEYYAAIEVVNDVTNIREMEMMANDLSDKLKNLFEDIEDGDLTTRVEWEHEKWNQIVEGINNLIESYSNTIKDLEQVVDQVSSSSEELTSSMHEAKKASDEISTSIQSIADNANKQDQEVDKISGEMSNLSATSEEIASSSEDVTELSEKTLEMAEEGGKTVDEVADETNEVAEKADEARRDLEKLQEQLEEINQIVDMISDIANQTNLLALNAAIEAARAGEQGKGFAVVADEVKNLAGESGDAAEEIRDMIEEIQETMDNTADTTIEAVKGMQTTNSSMNEVKDNFSEIQGSVKEVNEGIKEVLDANKQQAQSVEEVVKEVDEVSQMATDISSKAEDSAAASEEQTSSFSEISEMSQNLNSLAETLRKQVKNYETGE